MNLSLKPLIGKLNETCRQALEGAAGLCLSRTNYDVDLEHILLKLSESHDTDFQKILRHWEIEPGRLVRDLTRAVDGLKTGNARTPALSPRIPRLISDAWSVASIECGSSQIRSGHLALGLLMSEELAPLAREASRELQKIEPEELRKRFSEITAGSSEV